jgi:hypothetical protein
MIYHSIVIKKLFEAKGEETKASWAGEMCNERICGANFSIPSLASKLKEVAQNPFSTAPKKNWLRI